MRIVFATQNPEKLREIMDIMSDTDCEFFSLKEMGLDLKIKEDGKTFAENAFIKAKLIYDILKTEEKLNDTIVMADDSGLCIDFLKGEPGVHSSRFMGERTSYDIKNSALLEKLLGVSDDERGAAFYCHITALSTDGRRFDAIGKLSGIIAHEIRGKGGFGYDPIFLLPERDVTVAQLTEDEKNKISHRGRALKKMKSILSKEGLVRILR